MDRNTPIRELKGVGPKSGELLEKKGLFTAGDLLTWYPRSYEVPEDPVQAADAAEGPSALRLYIIGNGSLFLQIQQDLCQNCNECPISRTCPSDAIRRVSYNEAYQLKDHA